MGKMGDGWSIDGTEREVMLSGTSAAAAPLQLAWELINGPGRTRTCDLPIMSRLL